jgi:competence protein ComEC
VRFEWLHPSAAELAQAHAGGTSIKPNAISCVLKITAANGLAALLTGDIEAAQELGLVQAQASALRASFLLAPHHGSKTSSTQAFLQAVSPQHVLVQAGYRNRFGHPAAEVVARYEAAESQIWNNATCGAATWRSDAPESVRCERQAELRYWSHRMEPEVVEGLR